MTKSQTKCDLIQYLKIPTRYRQISFHFFRQNAGESENQCKTHVSVLEVVSKYRQAGWKNSAAPCISTTFSVFRNHF